MLNQINLEEILFLDIETVPQFAGYNELDDDSKSHWLDKSKFNRERRNLEVEESYHEAGIYAEFGKIICLSAGFFSTRFGERAFRVTSYYGDDEAKLLTDFSEMLEASTNNPIRVLCAHNGKEFDFPYICRRLLIHRIPLPGLLDIAGKKPWEISHLDTMELWKFGDYKHYTSLKLLAKVFGVPTPKDDIDGSEVRTVYYTDNDLDRIERYCKKDVITIARIFQCYRGEDFFDDASVIHV
jgi:3'-5' exonuclease